MPLMAEIEGIKCYKCNATAPHYFGHDDPNPNYEPAAPGTIQLGKKTVVRWYCTSCFLKLFWK